MSTIDDWINRIEHPTEEDMIELFWEDTYDFIDSFLVVGEE